MRSKWVRVALGVPLAFSVLVIALGVAPVILPPPFLYALYFISLASPIVAVLGMSFVDRGEWGGWTIALVLACSLARIALFILNFADPGSYYVWPVDAALSLILFFVGKQRSGEESPRRSVSGRSAP